MHTLVAGSMPECSQRIPSDNANNWGTEGKYFYYNCTGSNKPRTNVVVRLLPVKYNFCTQFILYENLLLLVRITVVQIVALVLLMLSYNCTQSQIVYEGQVQWYTALLFS